MNKYTKWFAWYPIYFNEKWFWFKWVLRTKVLIHGRADGCSEDIYEYFYSELTQ